MGKYDGWLIVSDMDGTLLTPDKKISEENINAIKYFTENGGLFTIATGRTSDAVRPYMDIINVNAPAILNNGAELYDFSLDKSLYAKCIEEERKEIIRRFHGEISEPGIEVFTDKNIVYIYRTSSETKRYEKRNMHVTYDMPESAWAENWIKVLIIGEKELLDRIEPIYRAVYDKNYSVRSGAKYLDIVANGVSKGMALKMLASQFGIEHKHIIAVGDNMNDISMLYAAGTGIAVANAETAVKRAADIISGDNNTPVVKFAIDEIIDKKWV